MANVLGVAGVIALFLWVPIASVLWVVSFWKPEVRDLAVWMLGIAGLLTTAGALTFMSQQVISPSPDDQPPMPPGYEKRSDR